MKFIQYYLDCLSQASYLVGDETSGRAVVVDPRREVEEYLRDAEDNGLTIELILETHFHADFLSGHLELAAATGAAIGFSSVASPEFDARPLEHRERISLGDVELEIRHTPGHTPESISIVVYEHAGDAEPHSVLTGDTLFIGDVGRPDLLSSVGVSQDDLADQLYDSLHQQLLTLPDATRVYPAHGAGSACGKNLSTKTSSTLGEQREANYALLAPSREAFVALVTEGQPPAADLDGADELLGRGAVLLDGRSPDDFARWHLAGAVNVGVEGRFAEYAGSVIGSDRDIILVVEGGLETEAKNRLARIGFDRVVGYIAQPLEVMAANPDRVERASRLTAHGYNDAAAGPGLQLVDVRNPGEFKLGSIEGASSVPVSQLNQRIGELDPAARTVVFCAGGYRSSIAASLLRAEGFEDVSDIIGGYGAWVERA
ncbi:MAG: MBL fold metallo-hydrolase [Actinomycetota bacterium]|nr:MBL fold metallo-hydrolase [Actinomycetota bacterium]